LSSYIITGLVDFSGIPAWGFIIQTIAVTFLLVLFGEVMPKIFASQFPEQFAKRMATPLTILGKVTYPLNRFMTCLSGKIGENLTPLRSSFSFEELSQAVDITGGTEVEEKKILKRIVSFATTDVRMIMRPRVEVNAIELEATFEEVLATVIESGYSRLPVYEDNIDTVKGFLFVKDLLPYIHVQHSDFDWHMLIRTAYFVPESKKINDLLEEFREKKIHLAVVVDEYGGTEGVVTLEDILEEIVGEISDETDEIEQE
jgi:CBS domain containing-hemolysin-like protein